MPKGIRQYEGNGKSDNYHGLPFFDQFRGYYDRWVDGDRFRRSIGGAHELIRAVNKHLSGSPEHAMNHSLFNRVLAGDYIPDRSQLIAMCLEFKLYGDFQQNLIEQAEALRRERADAEIRRHEEIILPFRRTNPGGNVELPSFAELVEQTYRAKRKGESEETINTLLWDRVFKTWAHHGRDFSPEQFCALIEHNNESREGKTALTNTTLYNWRNHPDKYKPIAESVEVLCKAFGLAPQKEKTTPQDYAYELMLWHIIDGRPFKNPYPAVQEAAGSRNGHKTASQYAHVTTTELDAAIDAAQAASDHGVLVRELIQASGISMSRLEALVGCQQLQHWCKGAHIESVGTAQRVLDIVHSPALQENPAEAEKQNRRLLGLLTGRIFDVPTLMQEARKDGIENPGGQLLVLLTGRKGLVTISTDELSKELAAHGHEVSEDKIKKMRTASHQRGGRITEPLARAILDIVQEKAGVGIEDEEYEGCVDILTNCPSPSKLLARCLKGELAIGEMVRMSYERKDMTQAEFQQAVQLTHISDFVLGKAHLEHESARKIADWLDFEKEDRRQFMLLATGHESSIDPVAIMHEVREGTRPRAEGLRIIFDASGMTRPELADASGVNIAYGVTERSQGRLLSAANDMRTLAGLCGLKGHEDEFIHTFGAEWIARSTDNGTSHAVSLAARQRR